MNRKRSKKPEISDIDRTLLSFCGERWLKVARIIANTKISFENRKIKLSNDAIDARMRALVGKGRLEAKGNIRKWRHSEVRLPNERVEAAEKLVTAE